MKTHCLTTLGALALLLLLSASASAADGIMWSEIAAPPPPTTNGIMEAGAAADGIIRFEVARALAQIGVSLLAGMR